MRYYFALLAAVLCSIQACSDNKPITGKELMPEMVETDSVQIIYFKSPNEPRYYTYTSVGDQRFINSLIKDVMKETQPENPCLKEGKIYCYKKGEVFNTIFFAYVDKDCTLLRYIKNGNLYYFELSDEVKQNLKRYRTMAVEPRAE